MFTAVDDGLLFAPILDIQLFAGHLSAQVMMLIVWDDSHS